MKHKIALILLIITCQFGNAQNVEQCRAIAQIAIESIKASSTEKIKPHLASDFTMMDRDGEIAIIVLDQLIAQVGENLKSSSEISATNLDNGLELKYAIDYGPLGEKESVFIFNDKNQIKEVNLFKIIVKEMNTTGEIEVGNENTIDIPFSLAGKLVLVDVILDGTSRKFILDTGSPRVILSSNHLTNSENTNSISNAQGVNGSISNLDIDQIESLEFGGIKMEKQDILTMDLGHLEEELNQQFYGLIGYELVKDYDILFDYHAKKLTLIKPDHYEQYKTQHFSKSKLTTLPMEMNGHIPSVEVTINNKTYRMGIDSGAEENLMDDDLFQVLRNFTTDIKEDELIGAGHNAQIIKSGYINEMYIGDLAFRKLNTAFSDISHLNNAYGINLDGLIGFQILSKKRTLISFGRKELTIID